MPNLFWSIVSRWLAHQPQFAICHSSPAVNSDLTKPIHEKNKDIQTCNLKKKKIHWLWQGATAVNSKIYEEASMAPHQWWWWWMVLKNVGIHSDIYTLGWFIQFTFCFGLLWCNPVTKHMLQCSTCILKVWMLPHYLIVTFSVTSHTYCLLFVTRRFPVEVPATLGVNYVVSANFPTRKTDYDGKVYIQKFLILTGTY